MKVTIDYLKDLQNQTTQIRALNLNDASRHDGGKFHDLG
jgi:hypothetical protein